MVGDCSVPNTKMLLISMIRLPTATNSPNPVFSSFFKFHISSLFLFFLSGIEIRERIRNAEEKFLFWIFVCLAFSLDFARLSFGFEFGCFRSWPCFGSCFN